MFSRYSSNPFGRKLLTLHVTKGALDKIKVKPALTKDGSRGDHHRVALLELSTPTGLTMEKYRKEMDQNLAHTRARLNTLLRLRHPQVIPAKSVSFSHNGVIPTIEEISEAEGEGSSSNGHTLSHSDGGKNSLSRRIFRRLTPSSVGRKDM